MILQQSTWPEVAAYLQRSRSILLPVGSTEQHGPEGYLGTDAICPEFIAQRLAESDDVLVGPTLSIGMAQHHLCFPGSIALRPSTMMAMVHDVVCSLSRHGFHNFLFLNGHGGNVATLQASFSELYADRSFGGEGPELRCELLNWYALPSVEALSRELYADAEGSHGTPSELSLSYARYPREPGPPAEPRIAPAGSFTDAADLRRRYPDGRIGCDQSLARVEHGQRFLEAAVGDLREAWRELDGSGT